ncbi:MAG: DUF4174 domain-containing protein [Chitinispirillaceae bacterium]
MNSLSELQWKKRILIVGLSENIDETVALLKANTGGIEERDTVWFVVGPQIVSSNLGRIGDKLAESAASHLKNRTGTEAVLIGKDGSEKARSDTLDLHSIFALIDSMPMRRKEMGLE